MLTGSPWRVSAAARSVMRPGVAELRSLSLATREGRKARRSHEGREHPCIERQWLECARPPGWISEINGYIYSESCYASCHNSDNTIDFNRPLEEVQAKGACFALYLLSDNPKCTRRAGDDRSEVGARAGTLRLCIALFHRMAHRVLPVPVGSSDRVTR